MVSASMKNSESAFMVSAFWHIYFILPVRQTTSVHFHGSGMGHGMHFTVFTDDFGWTSLPSFPVSHYYFLIFLEQVILED
jgi:hypothetical protein